MFGKRKNGKDFGAMTEEFLIKNTTRQQREQIVKESLGYSDIGCDEAAGAYGYDMYLPYIEGEMELEEITRLSHKISLPGNNGTETM